MKKYTAKQKKRFEDKSYFYNKFKNGEKHDKNYFYFSDVKKDGNYGYSCIA